MDVIKKEKGCGQNYESRGIKTRSRPNKLCRDTLSGVETEEGKLIPYLSEKR